MRCANTPPQPRRPRAPQIVFEGKTGYGLATVDPGLPAYKQYVLEQHRKQLQMTPTVAGVALDEQQFLGEQLPLEPAPPHYLRSARLPLHTSLCAQAR